MFQQNVRTYMNRKPSRRGFLVSLSIDHDRVTMTMKTRTTFQIKCVTKLWFKINNLQLPKIVNKQFCFNVNFQFCFLVQFRAVLQTPRCPNKCPNLHVSVTGITTEEPLSRRGLWSVYHRVTMT